jgi:hypothetical protein
MEFLWACRTFAGDNDVEMFVRHFEIHWAKRVVTVEDEEKEPQYGCCNFQTRHVNKGQAPVELAPYIQEQMGQSMDLLLVLCPHSCDWKRYETRGGDNLRLGESYD